MPGIAKLGWIVTLQSSALPTELSSVFMSKCLIARFMWENMLQPHIVRALRRGRGYGLCAGTITTIPKLPGGTEDQTGLSFFPKDVAISLVVASLLLATAIIR